MQIDSLATVMNAKPKVCQLLFGQKFNITTQTHTHIHIQEYLLPVAKFNNEVARNRRRWPLEFLYSFAAQCVKDLAIFIACAGPFC